MEGAGTAGEKEDQPGSDRAPVQHPAAGLVQHRPLQCVEAGREREATEQSGRKINCEIGNFIEFHGGLCC